MQFTCDHAASDPQAKCAVIGCTKLGPAEGDACVWNACDARMEATVFVEIIDGEGMLDGELHGAVSQDDVVSHDANTFDVMHGQRKEEFFLSLDAEGQVIPLNKKPCGRQVKDILDDFWHSSGWGWDEHFCGCCKEMKMVDAEGLGKANIAE